MFFKPKNIAIFDIGSRSVRAYVIEVGSDGILQRNSSTEVEYDGFINGEWLSESSISNTVRSIMSQFEHKHGKFKSVYVGVPGEFIVAETKTVNMTFQGYHKIVDKDIDAIYEKGKSFNNDIDYECISSSAIYFTVDKNKRLIDPRGATANSLELVASYILCKRSFKKLFMQLLPNYADELKFISSCWAQAFTFIEPEKRDNGVLLCDVGYLTTSVMLVRGDGILEHKSFSNGGAYILSDLAEVMQVPFESAVDIRNMIDINVELDDDDVLDIPSIEGGNVKSQLATEVVLARIEDICNDIRNSINNFTQACPPYLKIYLTGGGITEIRGATRVFAEILERSVEVIAPSDPGFNKPRYASTAAIIDVAARKEQSKVTIIKRLFNK